MPGNPNLQADTPPFLPTPPESPQPADGEGSRSQSRTGGKPAAGPGMRAVVGRGSRRISVVSVKDAERAARVIASSATGGGGELHQGSGEVSRASLLTWLRAKQTQATTKGASPKGVGESLVHDLTKESSGNSDFGDENMKPLPIGGPSPHGGGGGGIANPNPTLALSDAELTRRFDALLRTLTPAATAEVAKHLFQIVVASLPPSTIALTQSAAKPTPLDDSQSTNPQLIPAPLAIHEPTSLLTMYEVPTPTNSLGGHGPLPVRGATPVGMAQSVRSLTSMDSIASFGDLRQFKTLTGKAIADSDGEIKSICEFEVVAELGRGSYGAVSLVVDLTDGKSYAIKTMKRKVARKVLGGATELKKVRVDEKNVKNTSSSHSGSGSSANTNSTLSTTESSKAQTTSPDSNLDHTQAPNMKRLSVDSGPLGGEGSASMDWIEKDIFGPNGKETTASPVAVAATLAVNAPPAARGKLQVVSPPGMGTGTVELESNSHGSSGTGVSVVDREIAVMKRLNHKNIVQLYSVIEDQEANETHLVMQYIENGSPTKLKGNGTCKAIPYPLALYYMVQVSMGLDYLHRHGILHRDVKPENILIGKDHTAYVADFGVSAIVGEDCKTTKGKDCLTGTMSFFSPEAIKGDPLLVHGTATDVWAFGVTLYCMVYGRLPFVAFSGPALFKSVLENEVPFPQLPTKSGNEASGKPPKSPSHRVTNTNNKPSVNVKADIAPHPSKVAIPADGILFDDVASEVPTEVKDILQELLSKDPTKRISLRDFRHHPFVVSTVSQYLTSIGKPVTRKQPSHTRIGTHSSHPPSREPYHSMPLPPVSLADAQSEESGGTIPTLSSPVRRHVAGIPTVTAKDSQSGSTTPNSVASHHPDQELTPLSLGLTAEGDQGGPLSLEESFSPLSSGQFLRDALTLEDIQCAVLQQPVSFIHRRPVVSGSAYGVVRSYASRLRDTVRRRSVSDLGNSTSEDCLVPRMTPPSPPGGGEPKRQTTLRNGVKEFAPLPPLGESVAVGPSKSLPDSAPKKDKGEKRREKGTKHGENEVARSARGSGGTRERYGESSERSDDTASSPKRGEPNASPTTVSARTNRRESNTTASPPKPPEVHLPPVHRTGRKL